MLTVTWQRPTFSPGDAVGIASERFGLETTARELPSERDQNFLLTTPAGDRFVLKIAQAAEDRGILELQNRTLERLALRAPGISVPRLRRSRSSAGIEVVPGKNGDHLIRLLAWVPGRMLAEVQPHTPELLQSLGQTLGHLNRALEGFRDPAAARELKWDLARAEWIREHLPLIPDAARRAIVERHLDRFATEVLPVLPTLRHGVVYNDANEWNVVVGDGHPLQRRVTGVIDFGDLVETATVCEIAIGCAYAVQGKADPLAAAVPVVAGYHEAYPLTEPEIAILFPLLATRLSVTVVNAALQRTTTPDNGYLQVSEGPAWGALERLEATHPRLAHYTFRSACGLEPCPTATKVREWLSTGGDRIGPLLPDALATLPPKVLDLSVGSLEIANPALPDDAAEFTRELFGRIRASGASVGVGRYDEPRLVYTSEAYQSPGNDRPVPRTVHIGLDLFVEPGTPVLAPLDGAVHSFGDNAAPRDYGPTIVLQHTVDGGRLPFYSLYGHLTWDSLQGLVEGKVIARGEQIGRVGSIEVNGGWPPHLHFQLITDLLDHHGDFPGVARPDQREVWKSLSPDPNLVARIPTDCFPAAPLSGPVILSSRRVHLGPSLSISYRRPLTIVRGWMQHLYDDEGLSYLDTVNNVAHVGHCHPRVVFAGQRQMAVLNTNTRYLHQRLTDYAERLTGTLPEPLRVCFFVNSGSEANELAIRLARARTGRRGMVVVDVGYHGNTATLVDVSPYKHDGPGGSGPPRWVRKIPMPDVYRGPYRADDREAGRKYAAHIDEAITALEANGEPAAAFLCESILSCGGQIVLPEQFLKEAYTRMRAAGGVCIADEVQVGFGRVGSHFWAFETQGVVPDIVTLGKPMGNGHPLGAVVTTPEIARAFANGMEYFSTFGGNPVSAAIGLAVLDVVVEEKLQPHAREVGEGLLTGLRGLVERHPIAGDARGLGLFVGLELVRDRTTLEPADAEASYVANRLRDCGILTSTDGPFHNVLKIKPPMVFTAADADRLIETLDRVLGEDFLRPAAPTAYRG